MWTNGPKSNVLLLSGLTTVLTIITPFCRFPLRESCSAFGEISFLLFTMSTLDLLEPHPDGKPLPIKSALRYYFIHCSVAKYASDTRD